MCLRRRSSKENPDEARVAVAGLGCAQIANAVVTTRTKKVRMSLGRRARVGELQVCDEARLEELGYAAREESAHDALDGDGAGPVHPHPGHVPAREPLPRHDLCAERRRVEGAPPRTHLPHLDQNTVPPCARVQTPRARARPIPLATISRTARHTNERDQSTASPSFPMTGRPPTWDRSAQKTEKSLFSRKSELNPSSLPTAHTCSSGSSLSLSLSL